MTCEEYIIKRLERAEDDAKNIRNAYERNIKRIEDLENQLKTIAENFNIGGDNEPYVTAKKAPFFEDSNDKKVFQIIKSWMKEDVEPLPF